MNVQEGRILYWIQLFKGFSKRQGGGGPYRVDRDEHQSCGGQHQGHDHESAHHWRIDVGHHPSLAVRSVKLVMSRVARSMIRISSALDFSLDG